ncbi:MAG: MBL fold metallo-hydrolase, partial [Verrucomicrobiota bacterium]
MKGQVGSWWIVAMFPKRNQPSSHRMIQVTENCLQLRGRLVHHYVLLDKAAITLIDGGFLSHRPEQVIQLLQSIGRDPGEIKAILLTHGHIDHTLNLSRWLELSDARLYCPRLDAVHVEGKFPYRGVNRICGWMEACARRWLRYKPPKISDWVDPGDLLPWWGGLEVVPLPGHTLGHVGYYSATRELLFCGDLFANLYRIPSPPPPWFNVDHRETKLSIHRAL